jgi:hypothetical protein
MVCPRFVGDLEVEVVGKDLLEVGIFDFVEILEYIDLAIACSMIAKEHGNLLWDDDI